MLDQTTPEPKRIPRRPFLYSSAALLIVALYVGWIFFARYRENRALNEQAAAAQREADRLSVESMGGNRFEILSFYASPAFLRRGDSAQLCYSVSNAKSVRIVPPVGSVWPSYNRCLSISPTKDTTYTLTAVDASGNTKTQSLTLPVH